VPTHPPDDRRSVFTAGVERNMDALYAVALRLTRNTHDAQDLVAESVTRAWAALDSLGDPAQLRAWLFRIMRNAFVSGLRRKAVRPAESSYDALLGDEGELDLASLLVEESQEFLDWWANPEHRVANEVLGSQIMSAIDRLPGAFRATVLLVNVDGLTYDEAAAVLGVPSGTVRSRMKRGRTMLQKSLWQQAVDAGLAVAGRPQENVDE
jgi:RNA polymerase sigma-70 factor (ECF subfamily)